MKQTYPAKLYILRTNLVDAPPLNDVAKPFLLPVENVQTKEYLNSFYGSVTVLTGVKPRSSSITHKIKSLSLAFVAVNLFCTSSAKKHQAKCCSQGHWSPPLITATQMQQTVNLNLLLLIKNCTITVTVFQENASV